MSLQVKIVNGSYRNQLMEGIFPLVRPWKDGANGGFVTVRVDNVPLGHNPVQRVKCEAHNCIIMDANGEELPAGMQIDPVGRTAIPAPTNYEDTFVSNETEEEAMDRIEETFQMLDKIVEACARGVVRGLVVSGPPGVGKSFGAEKTLEAVNLPRKLAGKDPKYEIVSGGVSAIGLYKKLYHNRAAGQVLLFDDSDGILFDEESLNLLKAALNSGERRRICWNKESRTLDEADIPNAFDFEAAIIFLSNVDFEKSIAKGSRVSAHLSAIMSRCHYLDLEIGSTRDKLLRIKQIVRAGMLDPYGFTDGEEQQVIDFIFDNAEYLREVSLRMVKKVADFIKADPTSWEIMAVSTCLVREAKFKRLVQQRDREQQSQVDPDVYNYTLSPVETDDTVASDDEPVTA